MRPAHEIILRPVVTEKSVLARTRSRYTFKVAKDASKPVITQAIEEFFKVNVLSVHTIAVPGKRRRHGRHVGMGSGWKKAVVTLKAGQKIEMLEAE